MFLESKILSELILDPELDNFYQVKQNSKINLNGFIYNDFLTDEENQKISSCLIRIFYCEFYDRIGPGLWRVDLAGNWVFFFDEPFESEYCLLGAVKKEFEREVHPSLVKKLYAEALGPISHFIQTRVYSKTVSILPRSIFTNHYRDVYKNAEFFKECLKIYFDTNNKWIQAKDKCETLTVSYFQSIFFYGDKEEEVRHKLDKMAEKMGSYGHPWEGPTEVYRKDNNYFDYLKYVLLSKDPIITKNREEFFKFLPEEEFNSFIQIIVKNRIEFSSKEKEIMLEVINSKVHTKGTPDSKYFSGLA